MEYDASGNLLRITDPDTKSRTWGYDQQHHMTSEIDKRGSREQTFYDFAGRAAQAIGKDGSVMRVAPVEVQGLYQPEATIDPLAIPNTFNLGAVESNFADGSGGVQRTVLDQAGQVVSASNGGGLLPSMQRSLGTNLVTSMRNGRGNLTSYTYDAKGNVTTITDELTGRGPGGNGNGSFAVGSTYTVSGGASSVALGDLNGDGFLDTVSSNAFASNVSVLFGNGDGTLNSLLRTDYTVGSSPQSVTLGDLNGDGKLDIVTANSGNSRASVLLNNGDGTFAPKVDYIVGSSPRFVTLGDLNGDGKLDLITANASSNNVSVLLSNGDGTFGTGANYTVGNSPRSVVLGDFDQDGDLDLATANASGNSASVLLGNGNGTFAAKTDYAAGNSAQSVATADLNENGTLDLVVVSNASTNTVKVLQGNGDGTFTAGASVPLTPGAVSVAIGDVNQDQDLDLILGMGYGADAPLKTLLGNGNGTFSSAISSPVGGRPQMIALGDLDVDGDLDVVTAYNVNGSKVSIGLNEKPAGSGPRRYIYDPTFSQVTSEIDELGRETRYVIDPTNGNQLSMTRVVGAFGGTDDVVTSYTYTADGRVQTMTDPLGRLTEYDYTVDPVLNRTGELRKITFAKGTVDEATQLFEYDQAGNQIAMIDENGHRTEYQYDAMNRLTKTIQADPDGTGPLTSPITTYFYDANGNQTKVVDARNHTTQSQYDAMNRLVKVIEADPDKEGPLTSPVTTHTYDLSGNLVSVVDPLGRETRSVYDARDRLVEMVHPDGKREKMRYDVDNNQSADVDESGNRTNKVYDARDRLIRETDPFGNITRFEYDGADQLVATIDKNNRRTEYRYDDLGRRTTVIDALNQLSSTEYDKVDNVTAEIDPLDQRTEYRYDNRDRQTRVIDAENTILPIALQKFTATAYDGVGNILSITDPLNNTTSYTYDGLNRLTTETNQLNKTRTYEYDPNGNRTSMIDRNGRTTTFTYDALNRQTTENWLSGTGTAIWTISSTYDAADQLTHVSDPDSTYGYTYDLRGRLQTVDNAGTPGVANVLLTYGYDDRGNIVSVADTIDGQVAGTTTYTYDELNRTEQITQSGSGVQAKRVDFTYTPLSQLETINRYSDLTGTQSVTGSSYTYDALNRLEQLDHKKPDTTTSAFYNFRYDADSRIDRITDIDGVTTYGYDKRDQLTTADRAGTALDEGYTYDDNGNRTNTGYQTIANNRLQTDGTYTYTYDDEGNLKTRTEIATGKVREYTWDYRNRLAGVSDLASAGGMVTQQVGYTYDATNQRIAKAVDPDGAGTATASTTRFVYDRDNVTLEFNGTPIPTVRYLHGTGVDQILAQEVNGDTTWMLTDQIGTVRDLVDNSGEILNHFTYDSFGNLTSSTPGATTDTRYKFTGREFDAETGDYFYRARYYDPTTGRFLSEDPIGFELGEVNLYEYSTNRPTDHVDPFGEYGIVSWQTRLVQYMDNGVKIADNILPAYEARKRNPNVYVTSDVTTAWINFSQTKEGTDTARGNRKFIPDIQKGDAQGHIVAKQLGGSGTDLKNLFPQNQKLSNNRNPWRGFENDARVEIDQNRVLPPDCQRVMKYIVRLDYPQPQRNSAGTVISRPLLSLRPRTIQGIALLFTLKPPAVVGSVGPVSTGNPIE